ncbi:MAG TPA: patatin-like phospholipase family protein [Desulfuromonadales bacterium]|nr:patatin-like phospholipase family protein [Desulfuromonadales bacterium]
MAEHDGKTALVLAGGGIMGAAYEIGCLTALDRLFAPGFSSTQFDTYIGVSAGSVIATLIANHTPPSVLFSDISHDKRTVFNWGRKDIYRFDAPGIVSSCWGVVRNLFKIYRNYRRNHWHFNLHDLIYILQEQFPAGLFSLGAMQNYLCQAFRQEGILEDFHLLDRELLIPAYDLDRGERVVFGEEGLKDIPIYQAITASCAIPYFFRPHRIDGRYYIDGSIGRLSHIDLAIARGAKLIVLINPRVPMENDMERFCLPSLSYGKCSSIANLGITFAWEQAQRIESREKLSMTLDIARHNHPEVDILLIEPGREESLLFFQSPMSDVARRQVMTYGYQLTLSQLKDRFDEFEGALERHGIATSFDRLDNAPPADDVA